MKKQLMTTTALVAAGMLAVSGAALAQKKASKPKMYLGGFIEGVVGAADQDTNPGGKADNGRVTVDTGMSTEVHFKSVTKLDNGIKIRTRVELEGATESDQIDEVYMAISGGFGEVRIGSEDNAAHLMVTPYIGSWATQVGQNLSFDVTDWIAVPSGGDAFVKTDNARLSIGDGDSEKVTYFTPRIEGFQVGATYMPSFEEDKNSSISVRSTASGFEGFAVAANFNRKFDKIGIGVAAGYASANRSGDGNNNDPRGYVVGARVDYGRFRVAAGFKQTTNRGSKTGDIFDVGVRYNAGKNKFSIAYNQGNMRGDNPQLGGSDQSKQLMASYRRELGPGIQYRLNFMYANFNGQTDLSLDDNEGYAVTTSVRVGF